MRRFEECHSLASQILNFNKEYAELNGQYIPETDSIHYRQPGENGVSLLISLKDNSLLWAWSSVPLTSHLKAFKQGIRTSKETVYRVTDIKN